MPALSIRQPWAWLIVNGHKDIENRDWATSFRGRVLIHAGKTMSHKYYEEVKEDIGFIAKAPIELPDFEALARGGIVGVATISDCVQQSASRWFFGPHGFVLQDARTLPFHAVNGQLGFFDVELPTVIIGATHG